jgi:hypothetical protein
VEPVDERTCTLRTAADSLEWTALRIAFLEIEFTVREPPELAARLGDLGSRLRRAADRSTDHSTAAGRPAEGEGPGTG